MGMFDYIRCEAPLPDGFKGELQTKDFDCEMVEHLITADGRLMLEQIDSVEEVPKAERPYPDAPEGSSMSFVGCIRTIRSRHQSDFHGVIRFYGGDRHEWHEYRAKFTDGRLVSISLVTREER